ncbi:hypothetical protein R3W88_032968 [Solanum pinnatisectum]|uniref:Uncharacterized protein n=1 Tax=Solanum pinnatisectum TaxID=50273 RepID=A0AAV9K2B3_9SOLN|nr:hypothetical protein R3W88_032968 [Solanum pinnatisectum]
MALTIVTLQFHYGGCFVYDPTVRYANGITSLEKINRDVDELHIMLFHKITLELGVENIEMFGCRVNKKRDYYMLNIDFDVLNFLNGLKGADFVYIYVVYPISIPLVVEEILILPSTNADVSSSPQKENVDVSSSPHKNRVDLSSSPQIDRVDLSSSPQIDRVYSRANSQSQEQAPIVEEHSDSDSDSLYDVDENIDDLSNLDEELLQARQVNLDEIPSGPVCIDAGFEDIYKEKRGRFEGNLGDDDTYFDSSDPNSDISEDEGDHVENDEVVDPTPRKETTKIYFDPTAKKCKCRSSVAIASTLAGRPTNVSSSGVRPATTSSICGRPTNALSSGVVQNRLNIWCEAYNNSFKYSTSSVAGQKRKTSTPLRGGATLGYKRPRQKKKRSKDSWLWSLFWIRVLHSATLSSSTPTNIDLGYKPNGLRWKGRASVIQRQLREESYTSTQGRTDTHAAICTQGTH